MIASPAALNIKRPRLSEEPINQILYWLYSCFHMLLLVTKYSNESLHTLIELLYYLQRNPVSH